MGRIVTNSVRIDQNALSGQSTLNSSTATLTASSTFTGSADVASQDVLIQSYSDVEGVLYIDFSIDGTNWDSTYPVEGYYCAAGIPEVHVARVGGRYFRIRYVNGATGQTTFRLGAYKGQFQQLQASPAQPAADDADAIIVRPTDWGDELILGRRSDRELDIKFGRNSDIDTGTAPEDVWNSNGDYTGHDGTANEEIAVVSTSAADAGTVVATGTATGGSDTTLIDTGATFVTAGVAVGDVVINHTDDSHGFVTSIDSETQLTVREMHAGDLSRQGENESGDSYDVVTAASTGAAVVRFSQILDIDFVRQDPVYLVMNGITTVTSSGVTAARCSRMQVIHAGTGEANAGTITGNQATTTANIYGIISPDYSQSQTCGTSVPKGYRALIKGIRISAVVGGGSATSAVVALRARSYGGPWRNVEVFDLQGGDSQIAQFVGGILLHDHTDFKLRVLTVASNNTQVSGSLEYQLVRIRQI